MHHDRCAAVGAALAGGQVLGLELYDKSRTYDWSSEVHPGYEKVTLNVGGTELGGIRLAGRIVTTCLRAGITHAFFCHYERIPIWAAAVALRLLGRRVYVMNDSKFDDYRRSLWRENLKVLMHKPYLGGLAASRRSADYMRILGHPANKIALGYDGISVERVRSFAEGADEPAFANRDFLIVARLVSKKNLHTAIEAFRLFSLDDKHQRKLHICGGGPLEGALREQVARAGLEEFVIFHGHLDQKAIARMMAKAIALLLPSTEEQYGLVVAEAQSVGLPVIISSNCGACDELVRNGVNGFVVESENHAGFAFFMRILANDESLWKRFRQAADDFAHLGDVQRFVEGVLALTRPQPISTKNRSRRSAARAVPRA